MYGLTLGQMFSVAHVRRGSLIRRLQLWTHCQFIGKLKHDIMLLPDSHAIATGALYLHFGVQSAFGLSQ